MADQKQTATLIAAFDDRLAAEHAVSDLEQSGFDANDIGYAIRGSDAVAGGMITDTSGAKDTKGAVAGALTGSVVGGLVAAAVTALLPGVGPVLAAGIFATVLGYAGAGAAIGGILGALVGLDISEEEAVRYERAFNEGKAIVVVKTGPRSAEAIDILRRNGGYDTHCSFSSPIETAGVMSKPI